jgi:hypothetical protein
MGYKFNEIADTLKMHPVTAGRCAEKGRKLLDSYEGMWERRNVGAPKVMQLSSNVPHPLFTQAEQNWGAVRKVEFVRQEPRKRKLPDPSLALDMPILFSFENQQLLLWLVEFQEDKAKFSIYKLLRYTVKMFYESWKRD